LLVLVVLLVYYEYLRRVADVCVRGRVIVIGALTALMLVLFTVLVIRRILSFIAL